MADDRTFRGSRIVQLVGFGAAAVLVLAALLLAANARRASDARALQRQVAAALGEEQHALEAADARARSTAVTLGSDAAVRRYFSSASPDAAATDGLVAALAALPRAYGAGFVGATVARLPTGSACPDGVLGARVCTKTVAGQIGTVPVSEADLTDVVDTSIDATLLRRSRPGAVTVSAPTFSTQMAERVVRFSTPVAGPRDAIAGFVTVDIALEAFTAAARTALERARGIDVAVVDSIRGTAVVDSTRRQSGLAAVAGRFAPLYGRVIHAPTESGMTTERGRSTGWAKVATLDGQSEWTILAAARRSPSALGDNLLPFAVALLALLAIGVFVGSRRRGGSAGAAFDPVTGLPSRRRLLLELPRALARSSEEHPLALVLLDLNGFKAYNDRFGHLAGDKLLARLGRRLSDCAEGRGTAYRLGGGEFCLVASIEAEGSEEKLAREAVDVLTEKGEGFEIAPGCGVVVLPREATESAVALRIADQRLYANKQSGRRSAGRQSTDVLLRALSERSPELGSHLHDVAELAGQIAARMGMSEQEIDHLLQAAELHDVGKMAIPDAILKKPGPLDQEEWTFVRGHTVIGERIVSAAPALAPVAALIRSSHERWDGTGYPDRLAGDAIPLGARIVAVCDAFDAMIGPRPHRLGMTNDEALHELKRCAGTQFDPEVVRVFSAAFDELVRGGLAAA